MLVFCKIVRYFWRLGEGGALRKRNGETKYNEPMDEQKYERKTNESAKNFCYSDSTCLDWNKVYNSTALNVGRKLKFYGLH